MKGYVKKMKIVVSDNANVPVKKAKSEQYHLHE